MTLPPDPYADASSAAPTPGPAAVTPARAATEPMRGIAAFALLTGNAVFIFLGISDLLFVVNGWASGFGDRSAAVFGNFAGPVAIALPLLAMLIATHVTPTLPQSRTILLVGLGEYAVGAFFGVITYLASFVNSLFLVRATFDGLFGRAVWLAFLTVAATAVYRVYRALYPPAPRPPAYAYGPTVYGRPYPGQPTYPRPTNYRPGTAEPPYATGPDPTLAEPGEAARASGVPPQAVPAQAAPVAPAPAPVAPTPGQPPATAPAPTPPAAYPGGYEVAPSDPTRAIHRPPAQGGAPEQ